MYKGPYFSIITPMHDRSMTIGRAIQSCLEQHFTDYELLVVDDASSDNSVNVVSEFSDHRIRIFQHERNRGPCPARNTAIARARGEWFVMLDSDFALLPGALENLFMRTRQVASDIGNVASSCLWDTGETTPLPSVPDGALDYCGYLRWSASLTVSEYFNCIRREVFETIRYPEGRAWEMEFHMNLARRWKVYVTRDVTVKIFTDAADRLTTSTSPAALQRIRADAPDKLLSFEAVVRAHGPVLRECAPALYDRTIVQAGHQAFLSGQRKKGLRYLLIVVRRRPWLVSLWAIILAGLLGPEVTAWATILRRQVRLQMQEASRVPK